MTDIYAEFGINNAVMSSNNITEHEQNMMALPTDVRDGDDSIVLNDSDESNENEIELNTGEEGSDELELPEGEEEGAEEGAESDEFTPLGDPDADLVEASEAVDEYADGFQQMRAQAIKAGLSQSIADQIETEYETDNKLSEASLKALEAVGYSRGFVKSFINGQEALAQTYVAQIQAYAGGAEKFQAIVAHMTANSPDAVVALEKAIGEQDLAGIKTLINLGMASRTKKFGKSPERSVTKRAPASGPKAAPQGPKGFESQREMVAAMTDPRYSSDSKYRSEVEQRVGRSSW
jgi:hypothetical protein